ncbi:MAG: hypothetical protein LBE10_02015 [Treponema sp.]|jgi:hypothetical protein|nr:hypothetical protein [Treponema sp.]
MGGDASGADARREEMNRQKEQKLAGAQHAQRKELLPQLSLLRGSLKSFEEDKGSARYQNRVKKINIVEKALLNNPGITDQHKAVAKKDTPFLYSKGTDQVILKGEYKIKGKTGEASFPEPRDPFPDETLY